MQERTSYLAGRRLHTFHEPLPSPPLSFPPLDFLSPPLLFTPYLSLPLEVGPQNTARGLGSAVQASYFWDQTQGTPNRNYGWAMAHLAHAAAPQCYMLLLV